MRSFSARKFAIASAFLTAMAVPDLHAGASRAEEPGRLEFRILADLKHDREAAEKARAPDGLDHPPEGYRWVWLGQAVTGSDPKIAPKRVIIPGARWKEGEFAGAIVRLTGKNLGGSDLTREFTITQNTGDTLQLREDPSLFLKTASSFRIDLTPSRVEQYAGEGLVIREVPDGPGRVKRSILVKIDRHNVTEKDLRRVVADQDELRRPAIRFEFSRAGSRKFGALTREHLPEVEGTVKYQLGIILDGRLLSAPVINSEIRDAGIIELGKDATREEAERIIRILRGARKE